MGVRKIGVVGERKLIKQGVIGLLRCSRGILRGVCGIRGTDGNNKSSQSKTPDDQIEFHPKPLSDVLRRSWKLRVLAESGSRNAIGINEVEITIIGESYSASK